ncbi:gluconeogenesis factor YvcK family protein [Anaerobacillus isosaccharinicus]|uniref:Gluconeogenesis factor n=1 Tax=Anaerobacillus isosaccharinicus TaxID=1532552 RepID=A0A1S2MHC5_9BACI|nr:YvcK family protein [Anaerobacillus isosaccharinicus]MBA5584679.1 YvcK family protein [Anaerobacillus isosaccharinicus]QOY36949.1 YvcK family protein [Anaerobacillus isosaccharinicus]
MKKANIVVIGGGTGLSAILRGLKTFPVDITAIVTVADDGGSSGRLRKELNIPPPGDVRNVLVALSEVEPLIEELFQHRFENGLGLSGHSLGNLLLAGMTSITGDFAKGVHELSRVLNVRGKVLPAANQSIVLKAEMCDGSIVVGESKIPKVGKKIKRVFLTPENVQPLQETLHAIRKADLIVIGPGSLYTSVIPNLLVPGIADEVKKAQARKVYICNVMTQPGETDNYTASDHVHSLVSHVGAGIIDTMIVNNQEIDKQYLEKYEKEGAKDVLFDKIELQKLPYQIVADQLLIYRENYLRHDAIKLSQLLLSLL